VYKAFLDDSDGVQPREIAAKRGFHETTIAIVINRLKSEKTSLHIRLEIIKQKPPMCCIQGGQQKRRCYAHQKNSCGKKVG